jgi:hypothetical protein
MRQKFEFKEELLGVVLALSLLAFQNCAKPNDISNGDASSSIPPVTNASGIWPGTKDANGTTLIPEPPAVAATNTNGATTCVYNVASYNEAAQAYGDPCPGLSCPGDVGPQLTCHSGFWYYSNGTDLCAAGVPSTYASQAQGVAYLRGMGCSI